MHANITSEIKMITVFLIFSNFITTAIFITFLNTTFRDRKN